jgi:hypothetical protein
MSDSATKTRTERSVRITINGADYEAPHVATGRLLLALAGLPETNHLFLEVAGPGEDRPIGLDVEIKIHVGMCFYDVPVGTFG